MQLRTLVWKELRERPSAMLTSLLAITLGVASFVALRHVTVASETEVGRQMQSLGANVLILPKGASLQDYYSADLHGQTLLEEEVSRIWLANLAGVEKLSPKLCVATKVGDQAATLTGVLPQSEFQAKAAWRTVQLFKNKHAGCKRAACQQPEATTPDALVTQRVIEKLSGNEVVLGADVADAARVQPGSKLTLLGESFTVIGLLPRTGTVDDSRVFAHLHTVQRLANAGEVVNSIEVMACCDDAAGQLVSQLQQLLPDSKVVTISHIVSAQIGVNRMMGRVSFGVLLIVTLVGVATVASTISANVRERRREIGTLLALGATPGWIARLFLYKAWLLGLFASVIGCAIGLAVAKWWGAEWAGVPITILPGLSGLTVLAAVLLTLASAYWPARSAAKLDPCVCFRDV